LPKKWIAECEKSHPTCKSRISNDFIPTRVIDVGTHPTDTPCLRIKDECLELVPGRKYATLSHCWGSDPSKIKRLLTKNLRAMKKSIDMALLPKTFQNAIRITRDLGVRYLWIDSLCIIQDDAKDWFKESNIMGDVYSNSHCTISATGANDGSEGLFLDREQLVRGSFLRVKASWDGQGPRKYYERDGILSKLPQGKKDTELWSREVDSATLNSRGWVLQERFLSRRNLMFGRNCLFWECDGKRAIFSISGTNICIFVLTRKDSEVNGAAGAPNAYRYWNEIVEYYSKKHLTKESDRLVALYGIAQSIQKQYTKDEYVAGLWKEHLINQLMWTTYKNLKKRRPAAYRAPSWSWASVIGKLMFRDILEAETHDKVARVEEVKVYTVEGKEGQVTGGYILKSMARSSQVHGSPWMERASPYRIAKRTVRLHYGTIPGLPSQLLLSQWRKSLALCSGILTSKKARLKMERLFALHYKKERRRTKAEGLRGGP
ncbi:HET-domain-containing protein, partial [Stipitochalara longipes BDJ]